MFEVDNSNCAYTLYSLFITISCFAGFRCICWVLLVKLLDVGLCVCVLLVYFVGFSLLLWVALLCWC